MTKKSRLEVLAASWRRCFLAPGVVLLIVGAAGCATEPLPTSPICETDEELTAVEACDATYACCTRACADTRSRSEPSVNRDCMNACAASLEKCYRAVK